MLYQCNMGKVFSSIVGDRYARLLESFEKGKRASIGEIRTWSGEKYQRTETGWKYLGKDTKSAESEEKPKPSPIKWKKPLTEENFTGWPDWDEAGDIEQASDAVREIEASEDFQKTHSFTDFYWKNDNMLLLDYLSSDMDLDDKRYIASALKLTGMLSTDVPGFEFTEPVSDPSFYEDELGNEDVSIIYAYAGDKVPKEIKDLGRYDKETGLFYIYSYDMEQGTFEGRAHGKIPKAGLQWVCNPGGFAATVPGYWCKDKEAKRDMMRYCGFEEYKKGKLVED